MGSVFLFFLALFCVAQSQTTDSGFISAVISEKGLNFIKNMLIEQELVDLVPLKLPGIEKVSNLPVIGGVVDANIANITLLNIDISDSTIQIGDTGVAIVASGANAALSMDWKYSYSRWPFPSDIVDRGNASVQIEGMEVGITVTMKAHNGSLKLILMECGCYIDDLSIYLEGGASWFYQWFIDTFEDQIRSSVEDAITEKIMEEISKLGHSLRTLPKEIYVDNNVELNVTFTSSPLFEDSSIKFDINGLFIPSYRVGVASDAHEILKPSDSCLGVSRMLEISVDEAVFNSAALVYFQAGLMTWLISEVPDQSFLNTASYKHIVPQLYKKYPNSDMELNITMTLPPIITIEPRVGASFVADMIVNVIDAGVSIPVACINMAVDVSGFFEISGNSLTGKAELNDFSLSLKWSEVGNFHVSLILGIVRIFLKTVFFPMVNSVLRHGLPLPIIRGFTLWDACLVTSNSRIFISSDVIYMNPYT